MLLIVKLYIMRALAPSVFLRTVQLELSGNLCVVQMSCNFISKCKIVNIYNSPPGGEQEQHLLFVISWQLVPPTAVSYLSGVKQLIATLNGLTYLTKLHISHKRGTIVLQWPSLTSPLSLGMTSIAIKATGRAGFD